MLDEPDMPEACALNAAPPSEDNQPSSKVASTLFQLDGWQDERQQHIVEYAGCDGLRASNSLAQQQIVAIYSDLRPNLLIAYA